MDIKNKVTIELEDHEVVPFFNIISMIENHVNNVGDDIKLNKKESVIIARLNDYGYDGGIIKEG